MNVITYDNRAAFRYQLRLPTFEGPLDLLLKLIDRQQLPISEISLMMVSDQFLKAARDLAGESPETVAEFTTIGSQLVAMKARSLLPRLRVEVDDNESDDLVVQLLEYRAVKVAAQQFGQLDVLGESSFVRGDDAINIPGRTGQLPLAKHEPLLLARAIRRRLSLSSPVKRIAAVRPAVSLRVMVDRMLDLLGSGHISFQSVSSTSCRDADEKRALFLALLVLIRRRIVDAVQFEPFGEIEIRQLSPIGSMSLRDIEEFS
jgi:segregation and condensation protein A